MKQISQWSQDKKQAELAKTIKKSVYTYDKIERVEIRRRKIGPKDDFIVNIHVHGISHLGNTIHESIEVHIKQFKGQNYGR